MRAGGKQRAVDKKAKGLGLPHPPNCRPSFPRLYTRPVRVWWGDVGGDMHVTKGGTTRRAAHIESLGIAGSIGVIAFQQWLGTVSSSRKAKVMQNERVKVLHLFHFLLLSRYCCHFTNGSASSCTLCLLLQPFPPAASFPPSLLLGTTTAPCSSKASSTPPKYASE